MPSSLVAYSYLVYRQIGYRQIVTMVWYALEERDALVLVTPTHPLPPIPSTQARWLRRIVL